MKPLLVLEQNNNFWYIVAGILLLFAIFQNLGDMPMLSDDGLRGLTALEMELSGNYLVPTQWGELYYKKPPLFIWLIVLSHKLTGNWSNFTIRLPMVLSYLLFGLIIFGFLKRIYNDRRLAWLNTFVFWTIGHIILIEIKKGMIDLTFSGVVYMQLLFIFYYYERKKYWLLFITSYSCAAFAFLLKGMPPVVFQGFTLLAWFVAHKEFKKLVSIPHIVGGLCFLAILATYYSVYSHYNPGKFGEIISTLWAESTMRTAAYFDFGKFLGYFLLFPLKYVFYKMLPWSLLIICWWRRDFVQRLWEVPLLRYSALTFLVNIPVYWLSPGTQTRYILMLFPLLSVILVHFYVVENVKQERLNRIVERIFQALLILITLAWLVFPFLPAYQEYVDNVLVKSLLLSLFFAGVAWLYAKLPAQRVMLFAIAIILVRIGMNFITFPVYYATMTEKRYNDMATEVGRITKGEELFLYKGTIIDEFVGLSTARERMEILSRDYTITNDTYYIIDETLLQEAKNQAVQYEEVFQFQTRANNNLLLYLVKFKNHE